MSADQEIHQDSVPSPRPKARWVRVLPVLVLVLALGAQITLMATSNIDRQSGSGFAMFSSVDFAGSRSVVATANFDGRSVQLVLPATVDEDLDRLLYAPTDARADDLADELADQSWSSADGRVVVGGQRAVTDVRVVVRGLTADGRTLGSQILAEGRAP